MYRSHAESVVALNELYRNEQKLGRIDENMKILA